MALNSRVACRFSHNETTNPAVIDNVTPMSAAKMVGKKRQAGLQPLRRNPRFEDDCPCKTSGERMKDITNSDLTGIQRGGRSNSTLTQNGRVILCENADYVADSSFNWLRGRNCGPPS